VVTAAGGAEVEAAIATLGAPAKVKNESKESR
jgi:hypothetical protein